MRKSTGSTNRPNVTQRHARRLRLVPLDGVSSTATPRLPVTRGGCPESPNHPGIRGVIT